jgi:hypothetical protein
MNTGVFGGVVVAVVVVVVVAAVAVIVVVSIVIVWDELEAVAIVVCCCASGVCTTAGVSCAMTSLRGAAVLWAVATAASCAMAMSAIARL